MSQGHKSHTLFLCLSCGWQHCECVSGLNIFKVHCLKKSSLAVMVGFHIKYNVTQESRGATCFCGTVTSLCPVRVEVRAKNIVLMLMTSLCTQWPHSQMRHPSSCCHCDLCLLNCKLRWASKGTMILLLNKATKLNTNIQYTSASK